MNRFWMLALFLGSSSAAVAEERHECPHHAKTAPASPIEAHAHGVDTRGDAAMGFSHLATTHHFFLRKDGGVIEVTAKDPADEASVTRIRTHLRHITKAFAEGDFTLPGIIHDRVPPGVDTLKAQRDRVRYTFEEKAAGAAVRLGSADPTVLRAIHAFLRFQIVDHRTGDPTEP
jgi:hypothetical protein